MAKQGKGRGKSGPPTLQPKPQTAPKPAQAGSLQRRLLGFGEPAPFFVAPTDLNPQFVFSAAAGRWVVLAFLGAVMNGAPRAALEAALLRRPLFNDDDAAFFGVFARDNDLKSGPGYRFFRDPGLDLSRLYGVTDGAAYAPTVYLLDRALRVVAVESAARMEQLLDLLEVRLAEEAQTLAEQSAPILTVPRIFEPELCHQLIAHYRAIGGEKSGFMREVNGETVLMRDDAHKRRSDVVIEDQDLKDAIRRRIELRLLPMIERGLGWKATQMERYLVARYADEDLGFFRAHRDNTTAGTAHRKFAVSINLNEDYDGGRLRYPEFGPRTYKPPLGGATVFSCSLLHEATPVTRGERFVFVPFLYDDDGVRVREANLHKVKLP
jgi:predicted 2-oxoglutarate/Fe(II)-dependent dioxygenase YbiX